MMVCMKQFLLGLSLSVIVIFSAVGGAVADRLWGVRPLDSLLGKKWGGEATRIEKQVINEESAVIDVVEKSAKSVVTVAIQSQQRVVDPFSIDPFDMFGRRTAKTEMVQRDIGTGFVVSQGMIVTNKHVVGVTDAEYKVVDKDNKEYKVEKIYRDPINDLAILQVSGLEVSALPLGDSGNLRVGQFVIAIGTALGEFRHTVTTGVISGLGRGIQAGDMMAGQTELLDDVIQTDAAINPGNSGGPLLNSSGEVVGVNVAVAGNAQNIGFAIPINVIAESLTNFEDTGRFERPMLGVTYQLISKQVAILNEVPEGAYVRQIGTGTPAEKAGVKVGDIITEIDGVKVKDSKGGLAGMIGKKKSGDVVKLKIYRQGAEISIEARLEVAEEIKAN